VCAAPARGGGDGGDGGDGGGNDDDVIGVARGG